MSDEQTRYTVKMHPAALKEYQRLDHSVAEIVDKKLGDLETRGGEIGKPLGGNLAGYREIKLRAAGIRIIYEVLTEVSSSQAVVYILAIQKRDKDLAFAQAAKRNKG